MRPRRVQILGRRRNAATNADQCRSSDSPSTSPKLAVIAVQTAKLEPDVLGREFDEEFVAHCEERDVDACGENGEFHTFAYAGPMFARPVRVTTGRTTEREGFVFADLVPG